MDLLRLQLKRSPYESAASEKGSVEPCMREVKHENSKARCGSCDKLFG